MAESALKIAVNTEELEKALSGFKKLDKATISAVNEVRKMEYAFLDAGQKISNVERVTRQLNDTNGKFKGVTQEVRESLLAQARTLDLQTGSVTKSKIAANDANSSYKGLGGGVRNASYQLSDFIVQVQGGTSALRAAGQQLPQLLAGFGLFGVVAGLASTVIISIVENFDLFATNASKATKSLERFNKELQDSSSLGDRVSTFVKAFGSNSADGWVDYVTTYNRSSAEQRKEMESWLDLNIEVQKAQLATLERSLYGMQHTDVVDYQQDSLIARFFAPKDEARTNQIMLLIKKTQDELNRATAARDKDFASATKGNKAAEQGAITIRQKIEAMKAEAQFIGVSNAEREKGVVMAELEAQAKRSHIGLNKQEVEELKKLIDAKHTALQTVEIEKYSTSQETANNILREQGMAVEMSTRAYQKLVEQKRLEGVIQEKTVGWNATEAEAFRQKAQFYLQEKQALDDLNYAKQRTFGGGALDAIKRYGEEASNIGGQVGSAFTNAFKGMEDAVVQFTMTGKASFSDFALSVIADIQRILVRQALLGAGAGGGALGGLIGLGVSAATSYFSAGATTTDPTAGGMYSSYGEMNEFAVGTNYVPKDQIAMIHKGEAIVPAQYNPAAGGIGGGNVNNVTVNVSTTGQTSTSANGQDANKLGLAISNAVKAEIIKQQRNGGLLSGA